MKNNEKNYENTVENAVFLFVFMVLYYRITKGVCFMRMRKKSWALPFLEEHREYVLNNPSEFKGKWRELLGISDGLLHVEIGCGKGDYFLSMRELYPNDGFVAIEKDSNCAAVAAKKALNQDHDRTVMINMDAVSIDEWFDAGEIDVIHLNFSDPWPKKNHTKRRLSHGTFLAKYASLLKEDGILAMKSDNKSLFEYSVLEFMREGWNLKEFSVDFDSVANKDAVTEYESRFKELGQPIYRLAVSKPLK